MDNSVYIYETKAAIATIKNTYETLDGSPRKSKARSLASIRLQEAEMWMEKELEDLNYPPTGQ